VIFPLAATPLSVVVNGKVVRSYNAPFVRAGHVMAPLDPFVTAVAASIEYSGGTLVVRRADRFAQVPMRRCCVRWEFALTTMRRAGP